MNNGKVFVVVVVVVVFIFCGICLVKVANLCVTINCLMLKGQTLPLTRQSVKH